MFSSFFYIQRGQFSHDRLTDMDQCIQIIFLIIQIRMKSSLNTEGKHDIVLRISLILRRVFHDQPFQFCFQTVT